MGGPHAGWGMVSRGVIFDSAFGACTQWGVFGPSEREVPEWGGGGGGGGGTVGCRQELGMAKTRFGHLVIKTVGVWL